jgi:hypothetical protein
LTPVACTSFTMASSKPLNWNPTIMI